MASLIPCPHCRVHCKLVEDECPHCGEPLRGRDGKIAMTAAAAVLGLTVAACGEKEPPVANPYGVPVPTEVAPEPPPPTPEPTGTPTATPSGQPEAPLEPPAAPAYGVAPADVPDLD